MGDHGRGYKLMYSRGTAANVISLKKIDEGAEVSHGH